jgi:hypothetical protein
LDAQDIRMLVVRSAPTIWGLRPANILTLAKSGPAACDQAIGRLEGLLGPKGVSVRRIHESENAIQIMIYRRKELSARFRDAECRELLSRCGYPVAAGVEAALRRLSDRMAAGDGFPHEIGIFLGYPPEDVRGFVRHKGKDCKYSGDWKVYGDVERCRGRFAAYDSCRRRAARMLGRGASMEDLVMNGVGADAATIV